MILASLRVMGADLDPAEVSTILGIPPSKSHRKGDARISKSGRTYGVYSEGLWLLESSCSDAAELEAHIEDLLSRIDSLDSRARELRRSDLEIDLFVGILDVEHGGNQVLKLKPSMLAILGSLGIPLVLDVYAL